MGPGTSLRGVLTAAAASRSSCGRLRRLASRLPTRRRYFAKRPHGEWQKACSRRSTPPVSRSRGNEPPNAIHELEPAQLLPASNELLAEAFGLRFSSLSRYEGKTAEAHALATAFKPQSRFERRLRNDALARSHLQMANYCRLSCRLEESAHHLGIAEALAEEGFENPETSWALLHFRADLLEARALKDEGLQHLNAAKAIADEAGLLRLSCFSEAMIIAREPPPPDSSTSELSRFRRDP